MQKIIQSSSNSSLIERAFNFAASAHQNQKRSSGEEYIIHPLRVAEILSRLELGPKTIAAGLLHDVPDDTEKTLDDIEKEFGKEIAFLVGGVSKLGKLRYPKQGIQIDPIEKKLAEPVDLKAENLRKMFFAMAEDLRIILIKLADRLHNMETLGHLPPEKRQRIALETMEVFAPLANRLGIGEIKGRLEDLAFPYLYPKEYEWLMKNVKEKYEKRERYLQKAKPILIKMLEKEKIKPIDVHLRVKHYWSLYQKFLRYDKNLDKIYDLVALRVIVADIETCYKTLGVIHKFWKPLPGRIKDYIAFPKPNTYRALHTTCFCLEGKISEIQIKTPQMHREAEYGIAAHWAHKEGIDLKTQRKKFAWIIQLRDWQKEISDAKEFWKGLKIDFFKNRIFVFTPRGDVIDLPEDATPVDFAYAVHTDIGNRCCGAMVNGKMTALSQPLKNGDVVEIMIDKNKTPSRDWLEFVKTNLARSRIKSWIKKESPLEKSLESQKEELSPNKTKGKKSKFWLQPFRIFSSRKKIKQAEISLAGERGIQIVLAKCCLPQPGNKIKAFIAKEKGASVHKINCQNLAKLQKKWPQRIIEASWLGRENFLYRTGLTIKAEDRIGLFRDASSVFSELGINILSCRAELQKEKKAILNFQIELSSLEQLNTLSKQLKKIEGVLEVRRA
jgi:GTP pyrophosphokinase